MFNERIGFDAGPPATKGGLAWGSTAHLEINQLGLSFFLPFNRNMEGPDWLTGLDGVRSAIAASPLSNGTDLFPSYGMPSF